MNIPKYNDSVLNNFEDQFTMKGLETIMGTPGDDFLKNAYIKHHVGT